MTRVARGHKDPVTTSPGRGGSTGSVLDVVVGALDLWCTGSPGVIVVAIDGYGASGKSTLADSLRAVTGARVVRTDDFFLRGGGEDPDPKRVQTRSPAAGPRTRRPERELGDFYDVARLRVEALEPLRAGQEAVFHPFDWVLGMVSCTETHIAPADLVLLDGVYSSAPELSDLIDRTVFVETPETERLRRLRTLVAPEDWDNEWLQAEKSYFTGVRPPRSFDLVVPGTGDLSGPLL